MTFQEYLDSLEIPQARYESSSDAIKKLLELGYRKKLKCEKELLDLGRGNREIGLMLKRQEELGLSVKGKIRRIQTGDYRFRSTRLEDFE